MHLQVFIKDKMIAELDFDPKTKIVENYKTYSDDIYFLPFGMHNRVSYMGLIDFLEFRCFPKTRQNVKKLLDALGIPEYDPIAITKRTYGRMYSDYMWLKYDYEDITYDDIKIRD